MAAVQTIESAFGDQDIVFKVQQEDKVIDYDEEEVRGRTETNAWVMHVVIQTITDTQERSCIL